MQYVEPKNIDTAVALLSGGQKARILAGGTDILVQMKLGHPPPDLLINIKGIADLNAITLAAGEAMIGAAVPAAKITAHAALKAAWPGLVEAIGLIGSTQIQGRATLVGNLCNGSPAADSVPALLVAKAKAHIAGPQGLREETVADVLVGPGRIKLGAGEFITGISLPPVAARSADAYLRFIPRTEMDIAVAGVAVGVALDENNVVRGARIALGAVGPVALLVPEAAAILVGSQLEPAALTACAAACAAACSPIDDKRGSAEFRIKIVGVLAKRAAKIAYKRAGGSL